MGCNWPAPAGPDNKCLYFLQKKPRPRKVGQGTGWRAVPQKSFPGLCTEFVRLPTNAYHRSFGGDAMTKGEFSKNSQRSVGGRLLHWIAVRQQRRADREIRAALTILPYRDDFTRELERRLAGQ